MKKILSPTDPFNRVYILNPDETFLTENIKKVIISWQKATNEKGHFELARIRGGLVNQKLKATKIARAVNTDFYTIPGLTHLDCDAQVIRFANSKHKWNISRDLETTLGQLKCNDPIFKYTLIHRISEGIDRNIWVEDIGSIELNKNQTLVMTSSHYYTIKTVDYAEYLFCRVPATIHGIINKMPKVETTATDPNLKRSM